MRGVDNHKIWASHYIVLMNWTEYNVKEKKHEYLGVDLRLIPYDYSVTENIIISILVSGELLQIPRAEHPLHATQNIN